MLIGAVGQDILYFKVQGLIPLHLILVIRYIRLGIFDEEWLVPISTSGEKGIVFKGLLS
jgi:hypothetical protein